MTGTRKTELWQLTGGKLAAAESSGDEAFQTLGSHWLPTQTLCPGSILSKKPYLNGPILLLQSTQRITNDLKSSNSFQETQKRSQSSLRQAHEQPACPL